jgi:hypothetical protein
MTKQPELTALLAPYGAPADAVVAFRDDARPEHLRYLDLTSPLLEDNARPDGVVEIQGRPVLFVVRDRPQLALPPLRRALALREDGSFLGIIEPGRLTVYAVALSDDGVRLLHTAQATDADAAAFIPQLATQPPHIPAAAEAVHDLLFRLLDEGTARIAKAGVTPYDALSLAGRALFLRFLADRRVVTDSDIAQICPTASTFEACFATPQAISSTSRWLDDTFNGNLLPLSESIAPDRGKWFATIERKQVDEICGVLSSIMNRVELSGQRRLDWSTLNFAHIPVGLLSQVYERHSQRHDASAKKASVHYTPRAIAEYIVNEAFSVLSTPHKARILDPAAGGGVFLVAAFRKLVEARWRHDRRQPTTRVIRDILNEQLTGLEISESALRLTALSLYLTALEVDPDPHPVERLRFDDLRGTVLHDVRANDDGPYVAGSLGSAVGKEHAGRYDLVIGNPPWTALKRNDEYRQKILSVLRPIVAKRLGSTAAKKFALPDDVPDLAFLWRAIEWAKPRGRIAFAIHGRMLFKQRSGGREARRDLFRAVRVTGILNAAALRQTDVWKGVDAPFALLFAENVKPNADDRFYFVSPDREDALNGRGRIRVDPKSANEVTVRDVGENGAVLKTLFRGTHLDLDVLAKLRSSAPTTLDDYWDSARLKSGTGFQVGGTARQQQDASKLARFRELTKKELTGYVVDVSTLPRFSHKTLLYPRDINIYREPLVLISKAPNPTRAVPRGVLVFKDVAYNESFYGYSCAGHPNANLLARYLFLLVNSDLAIYFALLTSGAFGTERDTIYKEDLERFPMRPLESLTERERVAIQTLSEQIINGAPAGTWADVNAWAASLYGLTKWDQEVIRDTLLVATPFAEARNRAQMPPSNRDITIFLNRLERDLAPFAETELDVQRMAVVGREPWIWFALTAERSETTTVGFDLRSIQRTADDLGATQIFIPVAGRALLVGVLGQLRYWTPTRARLLAMDLLNELTLLRRLAARVATN